jgi:hypothetical protein
MQVPSSNIYLSLTQPQIYASSEQQIIINMKLLRSTFIAFCLTPRALAFTATTKTLSKANVAVPAQLATQLQMIGIKSPMGEGIPDEDEIMKEKLFRQVLQEISVVKDYLDYITEESIKATFGGGMKADEEAGESFAQVLAEKAAEAESSGDNIGLFGGGDADSSSTSMEDIKETRYQPKLRSDLGSTVLISGTADATLLKVLNNNFFGQDNINNFQFSKIKALVENVALAKKTAISREARYSGLLDKLSIEPSSGALPTAAELNGASSWIAQISSNDAPTLLPQVAELAKNSHELKHVLVLVTGVASNVVEGWDALEAASGDTLQCTLVAVGELFAGGKEGGLYHVGKLADATVANPASEAYQLLGHALALESTANQALTAYSYSQAAIDAVSSPYAEGEFTARDDDGNEIVDEMKEVKMYGRLLQGLRETGFTRTAELDVLVEKGLEVRALTCMYLFLTLVKNCTVHPDRINMYLCHFSYRDSKSSWQTHLRGRTHILLPRPLVTRRMQRLWLFWMLKLQKTKRRRRQRRKQLKDRR